MATGVELATAWVRIVPTLDGSQGAIAKELEPEASKAGEAAGKKAGEKFSTGLKLGISAASAFIVKQIGDWAGETLNSLARIDKINKQTESAIKSTGNAAGVTAEHVENLAGKLENLTATEAESVQEGANLLLTFKNIKNGVGEGNDIFDQSVVALTDMARAMGQEPAAAAVQLGKALNDPIKGISALSRVGIQFTDDQKAMIESMVEAGDIAGAQKIILSELNSQFGGSGESYAQSYAGQMELLGHAIGTASESIMMSLMPALKTIAGALATAFNFLAENEGLMQALAIGIGAVTVAIIGANVAMWVLSANPIVMVVTGIIIAFGALVAAIWWVITQTTFFQDVWQTVVDVVSAVVNWLWNSVLKPTFDAIGAVFEWLWKTIIKPIVDLVVNYFRFWGAVAVWLYENAVQPMFKAIGDIFNWIWTNVIKPVVDWITDKLNILGLGFRILYETYVKPAFDAIGAVVSTVWNWIDQNVFTPFKAGIDLIGKAFENTAKAIGIAWDGIKRAAAVPINFVLDTVWNNGLRSFWNDMVGTLGLNDMKLPKAELVKFANGGVENHVAQIARGGAMRLWAEPETGGEAYIPLAPSKRGRSTAILAEVARRFGYGLTQYADGGFWGDVGKFAGDVWDNVANAASVAWEFLSDPAGAIQKHVVDGIIGPLMGGAGDGVFGKTVGGLIKNMVKGAAKLFEAPGGVGKGTKGMGWQAMWNIVKSAVPGAVMTSNYRPGSRTVNGGMSYHASGRAIDVVPASMATFNALARLFPNASELIYTPAGSRQLLNGKPFAGWSAAVKAQHYNHVHLAMADGGILPGLMNGGTITKAGYTVVGEQGPELLKLPAGAQVNPDYDAVPDQRQVVFQNYAPLGSTPSQELETFANRAEVFLL